MIKLLSRKLRKELLKFPEDVYQAGCTDILQEAGWDLCGGFPSPAACCEKLSFFPWVCRTSFSGRQARRLRLIQKEGPQEKPATYITRLSFRCKEKQGWKKEEKEKSHFTKFSQLSVVPKSGTISSLCSVGMKGRVGAQLCLKCTGFTPGSLPAGGWPELGTTLMGKIVG